MKIAHVIIGLETGGAEMRVGGHAGAGAALAQDEALAWTSGRLVVVNRTLRQALERSSWNVTAAARLLGLSRDTVRYRLQKYGLRPP